MAAIESIAPIAAIAAIVTIAAIAPFAAISTIRAIASFLAAECDISSSGEIMYTVELPSSVLRVS